MGMFDYITCEFKLPKWNKEVQKEMFQTKSLECSMNKYIITKNRKLIYIDDKKTKENPYHGDIIFYTCIENPKNKKLIWYEYVARFTSGRLENIKIKRKPKAL